MAVMQALVNRAMTTRPVAALLDNEEPGRKAERSLIDIGSRTGDWKRGVTVFSYRSAFENADFAYEAEDLWPDQVLTKFCAVDEVSRLRRKSQRPNPSDDGSTTSPRQ